MQSIQFRGLLFNQFLALPGQVPKFPYGFGRNEAAFDQTMTEELRKPFTTLDIGFPAQDIFHIPGIGQNHLYAMLKDVEYGLPIDTGNLDNGIGTSF